MMNPTRAGRRSEREPHEYERGETTHPMQTDPLCAICGQPRKNGMHR